MGSLGALAGMGTAVFVHQHAHKLDPKRRLTIPADWRAMVGEPPQLAVVPSAKTPCLNLFPLRQFARRLEKMAGERSMDDDEVEDFGRVFGSRCNLVGWDAQGRIRISDDLLAYAGLTDDVLLVGALTKIELWSPEKWKQHLASVNSLNIGAAMRRAGL